MVKLYPSGGLTVTVRPREAQLQHEANTVSDVIFGFYQMIRALTVIMPGGSGHGWVDCGMIVQFG